MLSNMERYTRAPFAETTEEKTEVSVPASGKFSVVLTPGAFPVCAVCGKDCQTLANEKYHLLIGTKETLAAPMLCRTCKSIICQECTGVTDKEKSSNACSKCGSTEGFHQAIPYVFCDKCGKRALLLSGAVKGEAKYQLLDKGALPVRCTECQAINCAACLSQNKVCQKCGSSKLDLFVPGYTGTGVVIADVSESRITLAAPGTASAQKAASAAEKKPPAPNEQVSRLMEALNAPAIKFWINKTKALEDIAKLGPQCQAALPLVRTFLGKAAYRLTAIQVFWSAGEWAKDELPALMDMLEKGTGDDAAAAAMALGAMGQHAKDAVPALMQVLKRDRVSLGGDTGIRCAAAIALFMLKEIGSDWVTEVVREHLKRNPSGFPPESYLEKVLVISK